MNENMKNNIVGVVFTLLIIVGVVFYCIKDVFLPKESYSNYEESTKSDIENETPLQKYSKSTNIPILKDFLIDISYEYTIDLQRQIKSKSFLTEVFLGYYSGSDIVEQNGKIYLKDDCFSYVLMMEISESQLEQIKSTKGYRYAICSFDVKDIYPIDFCIYSDCDIDTPDDDMIYSDEIGDYVSAYCNVSLDNKVILAKCNDIYEIILDK